MPIKFPCGVYKKAVAKCRGAARYDLRDCCRVHIKCNFIDKKTYNKILNSEEEKCFLFRKCTQSNIRFTSITNVMLTLINQGFYINQGISDINQTKSCNITSCC